MPKVGYKTLTSILSAISQLTLMDMSKLNDAQRQELEQLGKQFQEHQQKQQQESAVQQQPPPAYDPTQLHKPYGPSYYYNYNHHDSSQQQYDASYYENYHSNAYQQQQHEGSGSLGQVQDPYVPPGINPAAVTALSQLTQFAMGGGQYGQGHFRPPGGQLYRGGGRQGVRGRGRGRGRAGRHGPQFGATSSHTESSATAQQPARIAWCELCQVDCTSKEILEQHNNGKRHKKNLQKLQDTKPTHQPAAQTPKDENTPVQETKEGDNDDNKASKPRLKRKTKGGSRGGKRLKPAGPPRAKVVIPLMCDLCNVKCDTKEVFDRHVAGKKHMAKLKRFEGHQAMYGPTAVQALYPPNPLSQTTGPQPAYYGAQGPYVAPPEVAYMPPHQVQIPNPQLADAPLEFSNRNDVSEPQPAQVSTKV